MMDDDALRRRRFLEALAAVPLAPAALATQTPGPTRTRWPSPDFERSGTPSPSLPPSPAPSPSPSPANVPGPVADALGEVVRQRWGDQLPGAELDEVKRVIQRNLTATERLRKPKLTNADEPVTPFSALLPKSSEPRR